GTASSIATRSGSMSPWRRFATSHGLIAGVAMTLRGSHAFVESHASCSHTSILLREGPMPGKGIDLAASVLARLLNRAKQTGDDYQVLLSNYCYERFLYRLGVLALRDRFGSKARCCCASGQINPIARFATSIFCIGALA